MRHAAQRQGGAVDHLEGRGLVQRTASAINRRYYVLYLTEASTALLGRLRPAAAESDKALAAKIGPRAYKELQRALSIFVADRQRREVGELAEAVSGNRQPGGLGSRRLDALEVR